MAEDHSIGVYLKVWGWLFVLSVLSYVVDIMTFDPQWIQWTLITVFALLKSALIMHVFMHLKWEPLSLVTAMLLPTVLVLLLVVFVAAEGAYIADIRRAILGA